MATPNTPMQGPMTRTPVSTHTLERLDVPGQGGTWWATNKLRDAAGRREEFRRLAANENHHNPDTVAKMRDLVDLGLWDDFGKEEKQAPGRGLLAPLGQMMASVLGRRPVVDGAAKTPQGEAAKMFSGLDWGEVAGDCDINTPVHETPVHVLHLLIEAGLDPDGPACQGPGNPYQFRLMTHMASQDHHEQTLLLFKAGANPRAQEWNDTTVAHMLALNGRQEDIDTLRQMIALGLDINDPGEPPRAMRSGTVLPPACMAVSAGNIEMLRAIVEMGADLGWGEETAFHVAAKSSRAGFKRRSREVMDALLELGAKIDEPGKAGLTPLWWCVPDHPEKAWWLIEHGARLEIDVDGPGRVRMRGLLERLVEKKASVEQWGEIVDEIERRQPDCWQRECCADFGNAHMTVAQFAMEQGGGWAARVSARIMEDQVEQAIDNPIAARGPRL